MATLLNAVTQDTNGTGAELTSPCTVYVSGSLGGGTVHILIAAADSAGKYVPIGPISQLKQPGAIEVNAQGTYFIKANLVGSTSPSCTVETT